jgi:hypothetical protein
VLGTSGPLKTERGTRGRARSSSPVSSESGYGFFKNVTLLTDTIEFSLKLIDLLVLGLTGTLGWKGFLLVL